jgi:toxin ParE1/3/4
MIRDDIAVGARCIPVENYLVFYKSLDIDKGVEVIRVLHGSRDYKGLPA